MSTDDLDLREIEQFVFREARYADEHDYDSWEALWTDDALYWVPTDPSHREPFAQMSVICDNRSRISTRLAQLRTGKRLAQAPPSHLRRVVSNVEKLGVEDGDTLATANFLLAEARADAVEIWAGRVVYRLRVVGNEIRLASKKIELVGCDGPLPTLAFLI